MVRKRKKEQEFLDKSNKILKLICVFTAILLTLIYCIDGGFYSLLFDLKESESVIIYSVVIIILLVLLIICNVSDEPANESEKQRSISSYITVGIMILAILFAILLIFTLIDFFFPIIVLCIMLLVIYLLINRLIKFLVNKYGIK